ncbi:hypothetical protein ACQKMD_16580 [Viridibacillus sp. NPDC096237]|uniref:hypothetical protein n=1 Tax=Viridibacillus sp. NPDC096237 TaxID=3390721 RepID=UPI003D092EA4
MEITISRLIILFDNAVNSRTVTKTFESDVIPHEGDFIYSTAFERDEEVEVSSVFIDYERNECYVYLDPLSIESDDIKYLKQTVDMYMLHEWKCEFYAFD